jgi:hypothetical protein
MSTRPARWCVLCPLVCVILFVAAAVNRAAEQSVTTAAAAATPAVAPASRPSVPAAPAVQAAHRGELYYFDRCASCERMLGIYGQTPARLYDAREVRYCSTACVDSFEADLPAALARLDAKMVRDQLPCYPIGTSIVTGEPLERGSTTELVWCNRLVRLANGAEEKSRFLADPERYIAALDKAAIDRQFASYPARKCAVRGDELERELDVDATVVLAGRMLRLCCSTCADAVRGHPSNYYGIADYTFRHGAGKENTVGRNGVSD